MNDLALFAIVFALPLFMLYVFARVATSEETDTPDNERMGFFRRRAYFGELAGKEVAKIFKEVYRFILKPFK